MTFGEKVRELRENKGLSQTELGRAVGASLRAVRSWETEGCYPKKYEIYGNLAKALDCDINYLMTDEAAFVTKAEENFGYRGKRGAQKLVKEINGLFAGGELAEEDMDNFLLAVQQAYIDAKKRNKKKYSPKKNSKEES